MITFINNLSRYMWVDFMKEKLETLMNFKHFRQKYWKRKLSAKFIFCIVTIEQTILLK